MFDEPYLSVMRNAIITRYTLLPYFYTLFRETSQNGMPVMRPMWMQFPQDEQTFDIEDQFMAGPGLMVAPITAAGQRDIDVYFPSSTTWYRYESLKAIETHGRVSQHVELDQMPVWICGGNIVVRQDRLRRSSTQMKRDPFTLVVALDGELQAKGSFYFDDGETYDYSRRAAFVSREFEFAKNELVNKPIDTSHLGSFENRVERIIITGLKNTPSSVVNTGDGSSVEWKHSDGVVTLERLKLKMNDSWTLQLL